MGMNTNIGQNNNNNNNNNRMNNQDMIDDASITVVASMDDDFDDTDSITAIAEPEDDNDSDSVTAVAPLLDEDCDTDSVTAVAPFEHEETEEDSDSVTAVAPTEEEGEDDGDTDSVTAIASFEEEPAVQEEIDQARRSKSERRQSTGMGRKGSAFHCRDSSASGKEDTPFDMKKLCPEADAQRRGLQLDLNQPWERSLLKELRKIDLEGELSRMEGQRPELMLLRHSESRDIAVEMDDGEFSLGTNASSTVPTKPQLIHRAPLSSRHSAQKAVEPATVHHAAEDNRDESPHQQEDPSRWRQNASGEESEEDQPQNTPRSRKEAPKKSERKPNNGLKAKEKTQLARAKVIRDDSDNPYLELEMTTDEGDAFIPPPDSAACFCMGTNVLDFWIPPEVPLYRRRRMSRRGSHLGDIIEDALETMEADDKTKHTNKQPTKYSTRKPPSRSVFT